MFSYLILTQLVVRSFLHFYIITNDKLLRFAYLVVQQKSKQNNNACCYWTHYCCIHIKCWILWTSSHSMLKYFSLPRQYLKAVVVSSSFACFKNAVNLKYVQKVTVAQIPGLSKTIIFDSKKWHPSCQKLQITTMNSWCFIHGIDNTCLPYRTTENCLSDNKVVIFNSG